ncbi:hypothetical protein COB72_07015 [bacterium]|nr:MAG: hypothetical protein COB72_07015 [bacterium]
MNSNLTATIDFSAQFGGHDAADAVLPHFRALKAAAKNIEFSGFPYPKLAFILRVDGEISQYGFSGTGEPDIDRDGDYLSIDIGITIQDRETIPQVIKSGIMNSPEIITAAIQFRRIKGFDPEILRAPLELLCERYISSL